MHFVFEHRAVSFKQLANRFFKGAQVCTVYLRLEKLRKSELLSSSIVRWKDKRSTVFGITAKGIRQIADTYQYEITSPDFRSDSVFHDLGVVLLRERLEKAKMVAEYLSESMLQSCRYFTEHEKLSAFSRINSDAVVAIETSKNKFQVAFEYELSGKKLSRYAEKLEQYYRTKSIAAVFYVCGDARIEKLIRQADARFGENYDAKVFICLEEVFHSSVDEIPFVNKDGATFFLR